MEDPLTHMDRTCSETVWGKLVLMEQGRNPAAVRVQGLTTLNVHSGDLFLPA